MTDADRLLREIIARPADDVLRLAYADAIEERRGLGDEAWAEFIRTQIGLAIQRDPERRPPASEANDRLQDKLQARERELLKYCSQYLLSDLPQGEVHVD